MKKNNKKKKLPKFWLGTRKPSSLGYLPNYGIGNALFTTVEGEDLTPEVKAARRNILPNTLNKLTQQGTSISNILLNTTTKTTPAVLGTASSKVISAAAEGGVGARLAANGGADYMGSMFTSSNGANMLGQTAGETAAQVGTKTALNAAGTVLSALGTAYGAYDIYNQFANAGDHRSVSDMRNTLATNTYTTDYGNLYTEYSGLNRQAELNYERTQRLQKQLNLGVSSIGTGASAGALLGSTILPGIGTGLGAALGAGLGAAFSGISSLFGFGDNEDEIEEQMKTLADTTSRQNRQSKSIAENQDTKDAFYGRAANGKQPVWSPEGLVDRKATARVSNGELIGNFEDGYVSRVPGKKNNKDTKLANLKDSDFVISNKYGLSDYAAATGDYEGALNMLNMLINYTNKADATKVLKPSVHNKILRKGDFSRRQYFWYSPADMPGGLWPRPDGTFYGRHIPSYKEDILTKQQADSIVAENIENGERASMRKALKDAVKGNYKCGKLPKHALGTLGEYALATLPHLGSYFSNLAQYNRAKYANKYVPLFEIQNPESSAAINQVMSDMIDPREYLNQSNNTYRQAAWNLQRNPAMGLGGRMVMLDALNRAKFAQDAQTRMKIDEANRAQRNIGAQMRDQMGHDLTAKRYDNMWRRHAAAQQANAAQENWLAQYRKNMDTAWGDLGADALRMIQYNKSLGVLKDTLDIYKQNANIEKLRALKEVYGTVPNDSTTKTTPASSTTSTTTTSATTPFIFKPYSSVYNPYIGYNYRPGSYNYVYSGKPLSIAVDDRFRGPGRYIYEQPWSPADKNYMLSLVR